MSETPAPLTDAQRDEIIDRIFARTESAGPDHLSPREAIEEAVRAAEGAMASSGWRDIATAPKDGTWILGWETGVGINTKYSCCEIAHWRSVGRTSDTQPGWYDGQICAVDLTHWQPLPSGPASVQKGEE